MRYRWAMLLGLSAVLALSGCKDKARELSSSPHILGVLDQVWVMGRDSCKGSQPNFRAMHSVGWNLERLGRQLEKDYAGANKAEVLEQLHQLQAAHEQGVRSKLQSNENNQMVFVNGGTPDSVRQAFLDLEGSYQKLKGMIR